MRHHASMFCLLVRPARMRFDYDDLELLRQNHPAWRLLRVDHAALAAGFLHRAFVAPNVRSIGQADLVERLEDELFALRGRLGESAFPKPARAYLDDWAAPDKGCLTTSGSGKPRSRRGCNAIRCARWSSVTAGHGCWT